MVCFSSSRNALIERQAASALIAESSDDAAARPTVIAVMAFMR